MVAASTNTSSSSSGRGPLPALTPGSVVAASANISGSGGPPNAPSLGSVAAASRGNSSSNKKGSRLSANSRSSPPSASTLGPVDDAGEMRETEQAAKIVAAGEGARTAAAVGEGAAKSLPEGPLLQSLVLLGSPADLAAALMKEQPNKQKKPLPEAEQRVQGKGGQLPDEDEEQDHGVVDEEEEVKEPPPPSEPRVAAQAAGEAP